MPFETWTEPGVYHKFVVPAGVDYIGVEMKGAGNGVEAGGLVQGWMKVEPGAVLWAMVGGQGGLKSARQPGAGGDQGNGGYGGRGRGTGTGGGGGGGASGICVGGPPGWWRAMAGGAGGRSGDDGPGGQGGADSAEKGQRGTAGTGGTTLPTGGDADGAGRGGKNQSAALTYDGEDGANGPTGKGGRGGQVADGNSHGGGGGGGGWASGGGGSASGGGSPGTGGGGGANYTRGMDKIQHNLRGAGNTGNGMVAISWPDSPNEPFGLDPATGEPFPINVPPSPPSDLQVNGVDMGADVTTRAMSRVTITATLTNASPGESTQMVLRIVPADNDNTTEEWNFGLGYMTFTSEWVTDVFSTGNAIPVSVAVSGLQPNQKYYVRAYAIDNTGLWSQGMGVDPTEGGYSAGSFWTNRKPEPPKTTSPSDNVQYKTTDNIFFSWSLVDPDDDESQSAAQIRTRRIVRPNESVTTDWVTIARISGAGTSHTALASQFTGNQFYMWSIRTSDSNHVWSDWTLPNSFFVESGTTPPALISPRRGEAVIAARTSVFKWQYLNPGGVDTQNRADIRVRVVGAEDWITYYGVASPGQPGSFPEWIFPLDTFIEGYHYEWSARTVNSALLVSDWSLVEDFWATAQPGDGLVPRPVLPEFQTVQPPLGCGNNRVFIFDRGGKVMRGEITDIATLRYGRKRDDISSCTIITNGFGPDCGALLEELRCWMHEIVIFRDGKRVWEGPVTRIGSEPGQVEIEARDVMVYIYRRIMRQGYNDAYREVNGIKSGGMSVVHRATLTTMNALAYDDPNVLQWITEVRHSDDAVQHRSVPDHSKMAWEDIDDLAANAGLDYTTVGRRIIYWDTHRSLGRLPEMTDEDFSQPVHVTEYGMQLANYFAVTNNSGVYGYATRGFPEGTEQDPPYYGWVEQLVSAYGETEGGEEEVVLTDAARVSLEEALTGQADRGISPRWPTPVVVRVPDNATLNPDVNLGFDQLIPGVWIPVRASGTTRKISQWQKLDSMQVEQTADGGERISVTMSPAPNGGGDPDSDASEATS